MSKSCNVVLSQEADILCKYITSKKADEQIRLLYTRVFEYKDLNLSGREDRLWGRMMKRPYLIPFIDSGLAVMKPGSAIRKRIFAMLSIIETNPDFSSCFIGPSGGVKAFSVFVINGFKALFYTLIGIVMVKVFYRV